MTKCAERNPAFDMMKGIAILLMVWEHCTIHPWSMEHALIYSFHMPLFFILGGYFAKDVNSFDGFWTTTKKNAKRLLVPYIVTFLLLIVWGFIQSVIKHDWNLVTRYVITIFWFSGDAWTAKSGLITAGPTWFLIALFWLREIFYCVQVITRKYVHKYVDFVILGICVVLSICARYIYPLVEPLPFGILPGIGGLIFYAIGWIVSKYHIPWYIIAISIICWPISLFYGKIELMGCLFTFPLDIFGACGATYCIYICCNALCRFNSKYSWLSNSPIFLKWCGLYSLPILCMHTFETHSGLLWSFKCRMPFEVTLDMMVGARIIAAVLFAYIVINLPYLKKIYR